MTDILHQDASNGAIERYAQVYDALGNITQTLYVDHVRRIAEAATTEFYGMGYEPAGKFTPQAWYAHPRFI